MATILKRLGCCLVCGFIVWNLAVGTNAFAQTVDGNLLWNFETSKEKFYPGEPVPLFITIKNLAQQQEGVFFGPSGLAAFSMEIRDANSNLICKGGNIRRFGISESVILRVDSNRTVLKSIVLNRWCSTKLSPGKYRVNCRIEYWLLLEVIDHKIGPSHQVELELDFQVTGASEPALNLLLEDLAEQAFIINVDSRKDWQEKQFARKMICFTESNLAVVHQLEVLKRSGYTWLKRDVIDSLVRSETLEAAKGLIDAVDHAPEYGADDVKRKAIEAVYALRERGKTDLVEATDEFIRKYPLVQVGTVVD